MQEKHNDSELERRLDAWATSQSNDNLSPELQCKLRDALIPSLTAVKPIPPRRTFLLIFLSIFLGAAAALVATVSKVGLHLMTWVQLGTVAALLVASGMLLLTKLTEEMVPGARQVIPLWVILLPCGLGLLLALAALFPWTSSSNFVEEGWPCAVMEIAIVLPSAGLFWLLAGRGALFVSSRVGVTLAGIAVALSMIPLQSQCMFQQAPHLLIWHGCTALLLIGLGAVLGKLQWTQ